MTKIASVIRDYQSAILRYAFLIGVVIFYFFGLTIPLVGPDEPRYAQVAREMFERGDWVTPTLGGFNWFEKPALLYWLEIASYNLFGVTEFAARFGSALFGLGTVFSLWILGHSMERSSSQTRYDDHPSAIKFSSWLVLIAASTMGIIIFSRGASFDIILTFPITAAMVSFFIFENANSKKFVQSYLPLISFYFFIGISILAKGLVGIVFPFGIVGFYYLLVRKWPRRSLLLSVIWGTLLSIAVASVWYLPMYMRHGYAFIDEFFIQHHFQRFTSNKYQHPQPFYFFFWILPLLTIPWLPFFMAAIWDLLKRVITRNEDKKNPTIAEERRVSPLLFFSVAWILVPLFFFSFSGSKLPGYILPVVPAAIILTADYIRRFVQNGRHRLILIELVVLGVFITSFSLLIFAVPRYAEGDSVKSLIKAADEKGFSNSRVLTMHAISYNSEFYAAGRLLRDESGKQQKLLGPTEVLREIVRENGKTVLVLIPREYLSQLTESTFLNTDVIKDNGELVIAAVSAK